MKFRHVIFKQILVIDGWGITCEIALIWMSLDFTNDQSTLVQVMAWCHQATSHYLSQCCPRSMYIQFLFVVMYVFQCPVGTRPICTCLNHEPDESQYMQYCSDTHQQWSYIGDPWILSRSWYFQSWLCACYKFGFRHNQIKNRKNSLIKHYFPKKFSVYCQLFLTTLTL